MTLSEEISRCEREVEACRKAGEKSNLTEAEKLGAILGEVDWLVARQIAEELQGAMRAGGIDQDNQQTTRPA